MESYKSSEKNSEQGKYPQKLEEMIEFINEVSIRSFNDIAIDPFSKGMLSMGEVPQLFIYKPSSDRASYLLYSIGPNGTDDSGKADDIFPNKQINNKKEDKFLQ